MFPHGRSFLGGYEDVSWGMTRKQFEAKYPNMKPYNDDTLYSGDECFEDKVATGSFLSRLFWFHDDRLYRVEELHQNMTKDQRDEMLGSMVYEYASLCVDGKDEDCQEEKCFKWDISDSTRTTLGITQANRG